MDNDTTKNIDELPDGAHDIKRLLEAPPDMAAACSVVILTNGRAMGVELRFPEGTELDEANPAHVFAWYIAHAAPDLLVAAINSWHLFRRQVALTAQKEAEAAAEDAVIVEPKPKLVDSAGRPITPEN